MVARATRLSRADMRALLLEQGRAELLEQGFESGSGNLTFKRVFDRVERTTGIRLTNASVIRRAWENLADFQADVLVSIAEDQGRPEVGGAVDAIGPLLGSLDLSTAPSRARALREVCRVGGAASSGAIARSSNWGLWINLVAMAESMPDEAARARLKEALEKAYTAVYAFWADQFTGVSALLRYRMRPGRTMQQFTKTITAYSEGCSIRQRATGTIDTVVRPTGPDGADEEWTLFAVGLEALALEFLEPVPD